MKKAKVLYVSSEIMPYLPESTIAKITRELPQSTQEHGKEMRAFMPKYGSVNERRNQLHEVIRLSGMNIIIDDRDHQLIIKVASIQSARMQVYFIDNDEFFKRKYTLVDENEKHFTDNEERAYFFCRGVLETVKKLGWNPDIIHCHGWMSAPMGLLVKKAYKNDPLFSNAKVIYSVYDDNFPDAFTPEFATKIHMPGITATDVKHLKDPTFVNVTKMAIQHADAIIIGAENIHADLVKHIKTIEKEKPVLSYQNPSDYLETYNNFYDSLLIEEEVLV
ncbi:MAG: glycogen/starch synthase [Bacteroidia bacterium]|nr:glycogen/starch synthase [Bacteroidia bacterium]